MLDGRRYWAFLSYSHADRGWARWLHGALENFVTPRRLVGHPTIMGPAPRRLRPIFRDRDDLAADAHLRDRVREALEASAFLIVLCSPAAARSSWVDEEISRFKALHGEERVLAVMITGSPHAADTPGRQDEECLPPAPRFHVGDDGVLTAERADPIAADLRPHGDGRRLARLKLLAAMLGVDLDELVRRDAQRRQAQLAGLSAVMGAAALVMTGLAAAALLARNEARHQRGEAEKLVEFMLGDLKKKLEPEGRLDVLNAVGAQALKYYADQSEHGMDADALGRRARVLHMLGEIDDKRGDLASALRRFEEAQATTAELLDREPGNPARMFEQAQSVYWLGYIADRRGDEAAAETQFKEYKRLADALSAKDRARDEWQAEVYYATTDLGTLWLKAHRPARAAEAFSEGLVVSRRLAAKAPGDRDRQMDLAQGWAWLADAERMQGKLDQAVSDRFAERDVYDLLLARSPSDNAAAMALVVNRLAVGNLEIAKMDVRAAVGEFEKAAAQAGTLMTANPEQTEYRTYDAWAWIDLADALLQEGKTEPAAAAAATADKLAESLVRLDPSVSMWRGVLLGEARIIQIRVNSERAAGSDARLGALRPVVAEAARLKRLADLEGADTRLTRIAAEAELLAGDYQSLSGRPAAAREDWLAALDALRYGVGPVPTPGDRASEIMATANLRLSQGRAGHPKSMSMAAIAPSPAIGHKYRW